MYAWRITLFLLVESLVFLCVLWDLELAVMI